MKKIVVSARHVVGTGVGVVAIETSRHFARSGHEINFVVDSDVPSGLDGIPLTVTRFGNFLKNWNPKNGVLLRFRYCLHIFAFSTFGCLVVRRLEREGFCSIDHNCESFGGHVLVLHNIYIAQYRADKRHWLKKIPQMFNPVFGFRLIREQIAFRSSRTKAVIAVSASTLDEARPYLRDNLRQEVIHSGINLSKYHPISNEERRTAREELGVEDRFVVLFVGHEFERKRLDLVLQALALVSDKFCLWVIGGNRNSISVYKEFASNCGVLDRVEFFGTVSNAEAYFRIADIFVLPSDYETWGLVVLEAMACGTPVIMTPTGCASHVIREGVTGYISDYNPKSIAEKLMIFASDSLSHESLRRNARLAVESFSWEKTAERYREVILSVNLRG